MSDTASVHRPSWIFDLNDDFYMAVGLERVQIPKFTPVNPNMWIMVRTGMADTVKPAENIYKRKNKTLSDLNLKIPRDSENGFPLLQVEDQYYNFNDAILSDETKAILENVAKENMSAKKLFSYGLRPKNRVLFCGPPGTGKTLSAKILSSVIGYPFVYVQFDSIISSYLGETSTNFRKIFDFIEKEKFLVLFDEFDMVGKKRDDPHEHGEVKRIVNNFIQMLDNFKGYSIIVAATNHQHLLDHAVWRRFDEIVYFDMPDSKRRIRLFEKYLKVLKREKDLGLQKFARRTKNHSAADIAQICHDALRKSIMVNEKTITEDHILWAVSEQKRRKKTILHGD